MVSPATHRALAVAFGLIPLLGCVAPGGTSDSGSGVSIDGGMDAGPDAGPTMSDAGPPAGPVGAPCTQNPECESGTCQSLLPGGYCTADCSAGRACPAGSTCEPVGIVQAYCLADCSSTLDCRPGYVCSTSATVCIPACHSTADCTVSATCDVPSGQCVPDATDGGTADGGDAGLLDAGDGGA